MFTDRRKGPSFVLRNFLEYRNFKQINNKSSIGTLILTMLGVQFLLKQTYNKKK